MKVLSLKQPYAELILSGRKSIELRKWNTNFRGNFLIHASKNPDWKSMEKFGFANLPTGSILGKARLIDVKKYADDEAFLKDSKFHLADRSLGGFGFILADAERIEPVPAKGNLNFWNFEL